MTSYSCVCFYMGSLTRLVMMAYGAATGPFVGLFILATVFPFVHSKGAGISTLLVLAAEIVAMWRSISSGVKPPHMPVSLDYCPENGTAAHLTTNATVTLSFHRSQGDASPIVISSLWCSLIGALATVVLGILISIVTGEHRQRHADATHLNKRCIQLWRRLGVMEDGEAFSIKETEGVKEEQQITKTLLSFQSKENPESKV